MTDSTDDLDPIALYAIERVAEGETLTAIAGALGMPMGTLFSRCTSNSELQRRYWLAKEASAEVPHIMCHGDYIKDWTDGLALEVEGGIEDRYCK